MGRITTVEGGATLGNFDGHFGLTNGTVTITAGNTSANFSHGLGVIPRSISVAAQDDNGADWKITAATASIITVAIPVPQAGNAVFYVSTIP